jgi:hypothetical protein
LIYDSRLPIYDFKRQKNDMMLPAVLDPWAGQVAERPTGLWAAP